MALPNFKNAFRASGAALAVVALTTPAIAQDNQPQVEITQASVDVTNISFSIDADSAANDYLRENPSGFAVAVRLGGATPVPADRIQSVLNNDLRGNGVSNAVFFFEKGPDDGGSTVVLATNDQVHGPYSLAESRRAVPEAARQYKFDRTLAMN